MAENTTTSKRHQRQRSSVMIKKRVSLQKPGSSSNPLSSPNAGSGKAEIDLAFGEEEEKQEEEVKDNALTKKFEKYDHQEPKDNLLSNTVSSPSHESATLDNLLQSTNVHNRDHSIESHFGPHQNPARAERRVNLKEGYFDVNPSEMSSDFSESDLLENKRADSVDQSSGWDMHTVSFQNEQRAMGDMTTREELDLFGDDTSEDQETTQSSILPSEIAPDLPPKDQVDIQKSESKSENVTQITTPVMRSQELTNGVFEGQRPANRNASGMMLNNSAQSTPSSANKGTRRLSLLINNGLPNSPSSPSTSPRVIRTPTASTPRSGRKANRMSLGYFPSPDSRSTQSPTPYSAPAATNGSIPISNTSSSGSISQTRFPRSTAPRSASVSTTASFDSNSLNNSADGETILTQHKGVLERIAEKERAILDLKEALAREEKELIALRAEWQKNAARDLASAGRSSGEIGDRSDGKDGTQLPSLDGESSYSIPTSAASDTFKGFSAKLQSGIGTQFNAFLEQLVNAPPTETNGTDATDPRNSSLGSLIEEEEDEEGQLAKSRSGKPPPVPSKSSVSSRSVPPQSSKEMPKSHSKRGSIFGASFAAFQKQMEQQFAPALVGGDENPKIRSPKDNIVGGPAKEVKEEKNPSEADPSSTEFSWGNLSKRFKEARENASGILAMAEAKLGQAMTIDDLLQLDNQKSNDKVQNGQNSSNGGTRGFAEENDREKAALAELSWLNSMAGIKMSGSVDRVMTSVASPELQASNDGTLNRQNLLRLEDARKIARAVSPASSSQSTTRPDHSPNDRGSNAGLHSPPLGVSKVRRTSASGVGPMKNPEKRTTGIFDVLSSVWLGEKSPGESTSDLRNTSSPGQRTLEVDKNKKRLSGQSRTRFAARAALDQGENGNSLSPSAKESVKDTAWDWDAPLPPSSHKGTGSGMGIGLFGMNEEPSKTQPQSQSRTSRNGKARLSEDMREISLNDQPGQDRDHFQSNKSIKSDQKKVEEEENWSW